jgi:hypothetical protein
MGAVHIEAPPIGQHLVQLTIVLRIGPFSLPLNLEPSGIEQRVFVFIIPDSQGGREARIMSNDGDGVGDGI